MGSPGHACPSRVGHYTPPVAVPLLQIWTEESLVFEDHPALFVLADRTPLVWTVRGLRHFSPRFALLGVSIKDIRTPTEFREALHRWNKLERQLLVAKLQHNSNAPNADRPPGNDRLAQRCIYAILSGDPSAESLIRDLEASSRST